MINDQLMSIDLASLLIASLALLAMIRTLAVQRRHNILTVKPIPYVYGLNDECELKVVLRSSGPGPLLVDRVRIYHGRDTHSKMRSFAEIVEDPKPKGVDRYWTLEVRSRPVPPGQEIVLLHYTVTEQTEESRRYFDNARSLLSELRVKVRYHDVYDRTFPPYEKKLVVFIKREPPNKNLEQPASSQAAQAKRC